MRNAFRMTRWAAVLVVAVLAAGCTTGQRGAASDADGSEVAVDVDTDLAEGPDPAPDSGEADDGDGDHGAADTPADRSDGAEAEASPTADVHPDSGRRIRPSQTPEDWPVDQWQDVAERVGRDPRPDAVGTAECHAHASQPLAPQELVGDPVADLRSGLLPSVYGAEHPLDVVVEFSTFDDYLDPSTPTDLDALLDAWTAAGFQGGIAAWNLEGGDLVMANVVEFASPESARDAATAHIRDLCHRAKSSERHDDGGGMTVLRESGAVRSVRAVDRYEISLFVCVCAGRNDAERLESVHNWRAPLDRRWSTPVDHPQLPPTNSR